MSLPQPMVMVVTIVTVVTVVMIGDGGNDW